jgi:hypothetical protein
MVNKMELINELGPIWIFLGLVVMGIAVYSLFFERWR